MNKHDHLDAVEVPKNGRRKDKNGRIITNRDINVSCRLNFREKFIVLSIMHMHETLKSLFYPV